MLYWDPTYWLMLPGLLLGLFAQARVKGAYAKYSRVASRAGVPAARVVDDMLRKNGDGGVRVERTGGTLTDHYDPRSETLRLSEGVYDSTSLAAIGIAAHEAGHALQKRDDYAPLALRSVLVPVVNIGSGLAFPLFLVGLIVSWEPLVFAGILLFSLVVLFSLITLPVEFNASRRAVAMLTAGGYIDQSEVPGVKAVLSAAALTYVASAVTALLQLLRLLLLANSRRRN